ncbi:restriction endonuclease subunit S [Ruminococcus sp.]|uniref:restriction endonuclease subunit S n=1 Tax=Ruminococcus sp. TaxID=41978 RepID=UPI002A90B76B|nr:restriction endonuclease subunit S [Ruminococcus sp.]MDY6200817.1 restriction endonuclease subunit S [Ruminococcus sp.]
MKCNWTTKKLSGIAYINPRESLGKGVVAKKVPMDKLQPFCRDIPEFVLEEYKGGTKFRNGDTIMARITPCLENGKIAKVSVLSDGEVGFGSTEYIVFRAIDGVSDADFLYYLICSPLVRNPAIKSMVGSSGRQRVQTDVVGNLDVELPPIEEQRKIGGLLKAIDDKIEHNNVINNNLLEQVLALYRNRFVDTVNNERRICRADEYFDISIGKTPPRKEPQWFSTNPQDVTWVSISDMGTCGLYIGSSSEQLTKEAVDRHNVKIVPDNTVLLSFKLTVGRIAITNGEMTTNEAIAHFKTDKKEINEYLYCYLKCFNYQTMGSTSSIATAVNSKIIKGMPFVVPTDDELIDFHSVAAPMFAKIKANQTESEKLTAVRDTLLPKLMSGELDVSDIEI